MKIVVSLVLGAFALSSSLARATFLSDQTLAGAAIGCTTQGVAPNRNHEGGIQFRVDKGGDNYALQSWAVEAGKSSYPILSRLAEEKTKGDIRIENSGGKCILHFDGTVQGATDLTIEMPLTLKTADGTYVLNGAKKKMVCDFTKDSYADLKKKCITESVPKNERRRSAPAPATSESPKTSN